MEKIKYVTQIMQQKLLYLKMTKINEMLCDISNIQH